MYKGLSFTNQLLCKIKLGYKLNKVYITHTSKVMSHAVQLRTFLAKLKAWGLISHYEITKVSLGRSISTLPANNTSTITVKCTVYLKYTNQNPAVSFWTFARFSQSNHNLCFRDLSKLAWYQPGILFIIKTTSGLLTISECLKANLGGAIFLALKT